MLSLSQPGAPRRPAWVEIDMAQLRRNLEHIRADLPPGLRWCSVVKDQAYGHGAVEIAQATVAAGAACLAVATLDEALELQHARLPAPILIFGERPAAELEICVRHGFQIFVNDTQQAAQLDRLCRKHNCSAAVQVEVDTGLNRYGVRWTEALPVVNAIRQHPTLRLAGLMTHFAMSDELDKTFAFEQLRRFDEAVQQIRRAGLLWDASRAEAPLLHACNSGGYLDLPRAHFDLVRMGILPLGVYPSQVCRRVPGLAPVMSVKTQVAAIKAIAAGDTVGYGMRYRAETPRTIAVLPLGYGDGFPRVRNLGQVLLHGCRAPIIGGNAMDAMMIDITDIPQARPWDEVVILGRQGTQEISVHELAAWGATVSYDIMTRWSVRLPRVYPGQTQS
ncbi:MAG: alanine racemase [candidate division KSB1 bacterium]|nr:alanine racemase [candidate division KSB1 bacterium]MDZ7274931.1 alanine racemase [candidate division KSB1 bacterium]MDZ7286617.1 alanine racemase [candidate division KSB1 bacterium]MDZ7299220.1 alanine racemase [candidate division KSB1 bacterium]MDZ7308353.1 alanine racemase [candidate division KSB1 bacterium]